MVNDHERLDRAFLALAHPVRRGIVDRLSHGPATVGEAARGAAVSKPAVSKHLRVLEDAGLLTRVVEGRTHRLSLAAGSLGDAWGWMAAHRALWEHKLDIVDEHLRGGAR